MVLHGLLSWTPYTSTKNANADVSNDFKHIGRTSECGGQTHQGAVMQKWKISMNVHETRVAIPFVRTTDGGRGKWRTHRCRTSAKSRTVAASRKVNRRDDRGRVHASLLTRTEEGQRGRHPVPQAGRHDDVLAEESDALRGQKASRAEGGGGSDIPEERIPEPILEHIVTDAPVEVAPTIPQERLVVDAPMPQAVENIDIDFDVQADEERERREGSPIDQGADW